MSAGCPLKVIKTKNGIEIHAVRKGSGVATQRWLGICRSIVWRTLVVLARGTAFLGARQCIAQALHFAGQHGNLILLGRHHPIEMIEQILGQTDLFFQSSQAI